MDKDISQKIELNLKEGECPLCRNSVSHNVKNDFVDQLKEIDSQIMKFRDKANECLQSIRRLNGEMESAKKSHAEVSLRLNEFEKAKQDVLNASVQTGSEGIDVVLERYKSQINELFAKRKEFYDKRDQKRTELNKLQKKLEQQYFQAEEEFVPLFKELSHKFLGLDLDIRLESEAGALNLAIEVRGEKRREQFQLSESQRFFIDIALRMALAQYISDSENKATLFIDTPEGSLDIAYESRAGDMFAIFVENGFHLLMTANINSSRLLISLAEKCGQNKMNLHRMTSWAELSEVQIEEEALFEEAYKNIEDTLNERNK